jgi:predicted ATPase/class 3 adenylate cyclase
VEPERRIVSVLFADLVGFTSLSESLDAEDVLTVQDAYFETVRETIGRYRGVLEKFIGDAVVAVFGVPRTEDDDAERAAAAGLALAAAVDHLGARLGLDADALRLRVGINTGEALVTIGGADRGPVTGDTVNVAARLQGAAPPGGVLVSAATALAVGAAFELDEPQLLELKGKAEPVAASVVRGQRAVRSREETMSGLHAPLLGREIELALLLDAVRRASEGASELILVVAPPGTGKSRLVDELERAATGDVVLRRIRARADALAPYEPIAQLVAGAVGELRGEELARQLERGGLAGDRAGVVAAELELLQGSAQSERARESAGAGEREAVFSAWLDGLEALAGRRSELWIAEDVHWAGGDTIDFLRRAAGRQGAGRLVVATTRPSLLESLSTDESANVLQLPPLSAADTAGLVTSLVGDALPPALVGRIAERSDGNPLFVEELLRMWISVGLLARAPDGWALTAIASEVPLPSTVQAIYAAQIDDLPPDARDLARRASVAGRRFPRSTLDPLGVAHPEPGLGSLLRRRLIAGPAADSPLGDSYHFRHALLRDAGYLSLARAERARLHLRLARWLEEKAAREPASFAELVGRHYAAAAESAPALTPEIDEGTTREQASQRAATWLERAAEHALALAAFETAAAALRRALDHTPPEQPLDRARRLTLLGEATAYAANMDEGAERLEEAVELARATVATDRSAAARATYARAVVALGNVRNQQIRFSDAGELANAALVAMGSGDDEETARLLLLRAFSVNAATDAREQPRADAERALAISRKLGDAAIELQALERLLMIRDDSTPEEWASLAELALTTERFEVATRALRVQADALVDDRASAALVVVDEADRLAEARGLTESRAWCDYTRAEALFVLGAWDDAVAAGLRAVALGEQHGYHRAAVRTWHTILPIAAARGDMPLLARAHAWYAARAGELARVDSLYGRVMSSANHLRLSQAGLEPHFVPDPGSRLAAFELPYSGPSWMAALETVVEAWLVAGELEAVRGALARLRSVQSRLGGRLGTGMVDLLTARLDETGGTALPEEAARRALASFRQVAAPWWAARAIRVLERTGLAEDDLVAELAAVERRLAANAP